MKKRVLVVGASGGIGRAIVERLSADGFVITIHYRSNQKKAEQVLSIIEKNQNVTRAVGGGEESFCYGFLDALGLLSSTECPVLFVIADDNIAEPFVKFVRQPLRPYAAAFLLGKEKVSGRPIISLQLKTGFSTEKKGISVSEFLPALEFIRWLLTDKKNWSAHSSQRDWIWTKDIS